MRANDHHTTLQLHQFLLCINHLNTLASHIFDDLFIVDDRTQSEDWFLFCVDQLVDFVHCSFDAEAEACCFCYFLLS